MLKDSNNFEKPYPSFFLKPNNAFILWSRGNVKRMFKDYQEALQHLDKIDGL
jgi:hypothetical protein